MTTEHRDLRTGQTVWEASGRPRLSIARLRRGIPCDVLVVGAGITGAMTADALAAAGLNVVVVDRRGPVLRCRFLVYATGYELSKGVPSSRHRMVSTWAIATRPQPRKLWTTGDLIWEASEPYLYARTTSDGRIIAGGEDGDFENEETRDALLDRKTARISAKLGRLVPGIDARSQLRWAGTFGESRTGLPTIGEIPGMRHCYAVLGYGGNGITFSMMASQIVRAAICGGADADADLFRFD